MSSNSQMGTPYPNPITPSRTRIGWIGIGVMGGAMAGRLLSASYSLTVFARDPSKAAPSSPLASASPPPQTSLPATRVRQVLDGVLPALSPNPVVVDHTTSHPDLAGEIALAARRNRCWAVNAPVSGGDIGARALVFAGRAGLEQERLLAAAMGGDGGSRVMEVYGKRAVEGDMRSGGYVEYRAVEGDMRSASTLTGLYGKRVADDGEDDVGVAGNGVWGGGEADAKGEEGGGLGGVAGEDGEGAAGGEEAAGHGAAHHANAYPADPGPTWGNWVRVWSTHL